MFQEPIDSVNLANAYSLQPNCVYIVQIYQDLYQYVKPFYYHYALRVVY